MSLLKQKKENDRIAAELAAKAKEEAILRELAIHPVVKAGCDRDVCDAYFHGLVFAAIADDEKVDADERAILDGFANSMGLGEGEVEDAIALIAKMSVDDKLQLIEECVCVIRDHESIVKLFYAQFMEVWMTGEYNLGELKEYVGMFKDWSGVELPSAQMKNIKAVVSNSTEIDSALDGLATWMGNDELKHFAVHRYGDVTSRIEKSQKDKRTAEKAEEQKRAKEEQEVRERAEQQARLDAALTNIAERYGQRETMSDNVIREVREMVQGIDAEKIDWMKPVNDILKEPLTPRSEIWKLAGLLLIENPDVKEELSARRRLATSLGLGGTFLGGVGIIVAGLCASDRGSKWLELEVLCSKCAGDFQGARAGIFAVMVDALEKSFDRSEIHTSREKVKKFIEKYLAKRVTFE